MQKADREPRRLRKVDVPREAMLGAVPAPAWSLGAALCVGDAERRHVRVHPLLWNETCLGGMFLLNSFCFRGEVKPCKCLLRGRGKELLLLLPATYFALRLSSSLETGGCACVCLCHSELFSHASPALPPLAIKPAVRTSR